MSRHWALIMARGQSLRMGRPKGLVSLTEGGPPLLSLIDELYRDLGWPRLVVTLADLVALYQTVVPPDPQRYWLGAEPGAETARTVQLGYHFLADRLGPEDTLWIHPVDLPLVRKQTMVSLQEALERSTAPGIRPRHQEFPGHPVGLKATLLREVFEGHDAPAEGTMKRHLKDLPLAWCQVTDEGVITDFDDPRALALRQEKK